MKKAGAGILWNKQDTSEDESEILFKHQQSLDPRQIMDMNMDKLRNLGDKASKNVTLFD